MRLILKLLERLEEHGTSSKDLDFAVKYLEYYGYIPEEDGSVKKYYKAVKKFQKAFGLLDDGYLGKKTIGAMNQPRCGLPDAMVIEGPPKKWNHNILTYYIRNRDGDLDPEIWDEEIEKAFNSSTEVCNVKFIRTNKNLFFPSFIPLKPCFISWGKYCSGTVSVNSEYSFVSLDSSSVKADFLRSIS